MFWLTRKFSNMTTFRGNVHNTTHTNHQPQPTTRRSNIHPWRGDVWISRWEMYCNIIIWIYFPNSPVFFVISQVSTAPITMPPTLTLRPTRWLGSPIYYLNGWRMKYGGEKSIATLSFLVLCKLTSFVFPLNSHSHEWETQLILLSTNEYTSNNQLEYVE